MAEDLVEVTRQRDEYWSRLLEIGRELLEDEEKCKARVAEVEAERDAALEQLEGQKREFARAQSYINRLENGAAKDQLEIDKLKGQVKTHFDREVEIGHRHEEVSMRLSGYVARVNALTAMVQRLQEGKSA